MNNTEMVAIIAAESKTDTEICKRVITSFEQYGSHHLNRLNSKHMEKITSYIAKDTSIDKQVCENIITNLFVVLKKQLTNKLLFVKA